jgi:hypothetical protein
VKVIRTDVAIGGEKEGDAVPARRRWRPQGLGAG